MKKPFVHEGEIEHVWLSNVTFQGGRFHGTVDNHPKNVAHLKMGDRASVNPNEITDWAFVNNGVLVGGYTIRVLYRELPAERQQALMKEANFRIMPP